MIENIMGFSIYEQINPINKDIIVTFNPDINYSSYKLTVLKNNTIYKELNKTNNSPTTITLSETGSYQINVIYYDIYMNPTLINSGIYNIDKEKPIILGKNYIELSLGNEINIMKGITATDNISGDITENIKTNKEEIDFTTTGIKKLTYTVTDQAGNTTIKDITLNIKPSNYSVFVFQCIFMLLLFVIVIGILIYSKSVRLENKISKFSINSIKENTESLFDKIDNIITKLIANINNMLYKSEFIKKYSRKYTKYITTFNQINKTSIDFISSKILCGIVCVIIAVFSKTIQFKVFNLYNIYLPFLLGFFIPDFIFYFKYKTYRRKMENDLLQAIIIMNNAFKSGRSIVQAIKLVSDELEGPISEEFKKMYLELSFGLGLDVVFNRFSNRINIEEVSYLTASLTILNKSGGNIIKVFSSIEKSLFNKKKLRLELSSLTSGSRLIVNVLMIIPLAFILLIRIINPTYFLPLFTHPLGYIIIMFVLIYYILYIVVIRRLLKVKI